LGGCTIFEFSTKKNAQMVPEIHQRLGPKIHAPEMIQRISPGTFLNVGGFNPFEKY